MDRVQVIKELEILKQAYEDDGGVYPVCLEEAIRLLKKEGKHDEELYGYHWKIRE